MSNGLGAGFGGLLLLAGLFALSLIGVACLVGAFVTRHRSGRVPTLFQFFSIVEVGGVTLVGGFGVAALYDEAWLLATLFVVLVFIPLATIFVTLWRARVVDPVPGIAAAGWSWSLSFLVGTTVLGAIVFTSSELGVATTAPAQQQIAMVATGIAGGVAVATALLLSERVLSLVAET